MTLPITVILAISQSSCKEEIITPPDNSFNPNIIYGTLQDEDGNVYKTVTIGTQTWMAQNLRTAKYNDGSPITKASDNTAWGAMTIGAYCTYDNTLDSTSITDYGFLYNFHAVNTGNLAPRGWHIPTKEDWETLIAFAGGKDFAGAELKEAGNSHWNYHAITKNNDNGMGMTALPGGYRVDNGVFYQIRIYGNWWTSSLYYSANAWVVSMPYTSNGVSLMHFGFLRGCSVLCIKD